MWSLAQAGISVDHEIAVLTSASGSPSPKLCCFFRLLRSRHRADRSTLDTHFIDRGAAASDICAKQVVLLKVTAMTTKDGSLMRDMRSRMPHRCVSAATGACC